MISNQTFFFFFYFEPLDSKTRANIPWYMHCKGTCEYWEDSADLSASSLKETAEHMFIASTYSFPVNECPAPDLYGHVQVRRQSTGTEIQNRFLSSLAASGENPSQGETLLSIHSSESNMTSLSEICRNLNCFSFSCLWNHEQTRVKREKTEFKDSILTATPEHCSHFENRRLITDWTDETYVHFATARVYPKMIRSRTFPVKGNCTRLETSETWLDTPTPYQTWSMQEALSSKLTFPHWFWSNMIMGFLKYPIWPNVSGKCACWRSHFRFSPPLLL